MKMFILLLLGGMFDRYVRFSWFILLIKSVIFLIIFYLVILSIIESRINIFMKCA